MAAQFYAQFNDVTLSHVLYRVRTDSYVKSWNLKFIFYRSDKMESGICPGNSLEALESRGK